MMHIYIDYLRRNYDRSKRRKSGNAGEQQSQHMEKTGLSWWVKHNQTFTQEVKVDCVMYLTYVRLSKEVNWLI